jgi:hypothetical protein
MAHLLGAVRVLECRPIRLASTQGRQVPTKGQRSQEGIDQAMLAQLRHHLRRPNQALPTSMHLSQRAIVYEHHTTQKLQVFARRALAGLRACATLHRIHINQVRPTKGDRTRTLDTDNSGTHMAVTQLKVNSPKCTQTPATSLRPKSSKRVQRIGRARSRELRGLNHLLPGTRTHLKLPLPSKAHPHQAMCRIASRAGVRRAST